MSQHFDSLAQSGMMMLEGKLSRKIDSKIEEIKKRKDNSKDQWPECLDWVKKQLREARK